MEAACFSGGLHPTAWSRRTSICQMRSSWSGRTKSRYGGPSGEEESAEALPARRDSGACAGGHQSLSRELAVSAIGAPRQYHAQPQ